MKIAVASNDGISIARHFGRSAGFIVFNIEDQKIAGKEIRQNNLNAHANGECTGGDHRPRDHGDLVRALGDCNAVLSLGMSRHAADMFISIGVSPFVIDEELSPGRAVEKFLAGSLKVADRFCRCRGE